MGEAADHIAAWQAAGLIDRATADRLMAAEAGPIASHEGPTEPEDRGPALVDPGGLASMFGPSVAIGEMFGYLGAAFLLAAWAEFVTRFGSDLIKGVGAATAAAFLTLLGGRLRLGDARRRRAAGVAFVSSSIGVAIAGNLFIRTERVDSLVSTIVAATAALIAAIAFRRLHPSLLTQLALLGSLTGLASAMLQWLQTLIAHPSRFDDSGQFVGRSGADPILLVVGQAAWWLIWAYGIGYLGLLEARNAGRDPDAGRRAVTTRLWAGLVAVVGLAAAVRTSDFGRDFESQRALPPWLGDLAILVLGAVLIERAFRRDATAFIWAAALAVIISLTDLNFTYLSGSRDIPLLIEGVILLAVGFWADRLRRRLRGSSRSLASAAA